MKSFFAVLRWVEAVTILLLTLRAAPAATRNLVNFIRTAFSVLNSPCFLFVLGNAIVLLLFFKYRNLNNEVDITNNNGMIEFLPPPPPVPKAAEELEKKEEEEEVVFEDKEVIIHRDHRTCRRSKSERMTEPRQQKSLPKLKRSKTDRIVSGEEDGDRDEFRRTIEAFIEKQLKFQRDEVSMTSATDMLAIVRSDEGKEKE